MSAAGRLRALASVAAAVVVTGLCAVPAASAENNGVGLRPAMGWSSWSDLREDPTEAGIEAQARAMVSSGLSKVGYRYVNVDDFWWSCPAQGPDVDRYGRWIPDPTRFPARDGRNGVQRTAAYVHHLGLKFGIYVTPGISAQAVRRNTRIEGTRYTADQIATTTSEYTYDCGGMVGIDYSKPGAQAFIDSWADELASWGADYVKLDGVGSFDVPDVRAWSRALRQTHRPIHLELSNALAIADARIWQVFSNGWRTTADIECYCSSTSDPLTDWANVASRFDPAAAWAPFGRPGAFNDLDSLEIGNGAQDGLTPPERQTQLSLWALAASPLMLGSDLTHLNGLDRSYLLNRSVISVDQDAIDAHRIVDTPTTQVFTKNERSGEAVVGLFNVGSVPERIVTSTRDVGLRARVRYSVWNLWTHRHSLAAGTISGQVGPHGVLLVRVQTIARRTPRRGRRRES